MPFVQAVSSRDITFYIIKQGTRTPTPKITRKTSQTLLTGPCIKVCRFSFCPQILHTCNLCIRDFTMECQQPNKSSHNRFHFGRHHSSLLETAEHGITTLGRSTFCVWSPYLCTVGVPLEAMPTTPATPYSEHIELATPQ